MLMNPAHDWLRMVRIRHTTSSLENNALSVLHYVINVMLHYYMLHQFEIHSASELSRMALLGCRHVCKAALWQLRYTLISCICWSSPPMSAYDSWGAFSSFITVTMGSVSSDRTPTTACTWQHMHRTTLLIFNIELALKTPPSLDQRENKSKPFFCIITLLVTLCTKTDTNQTK